MNFRSKLSILFLSLASQAIVYDVYAQTTLSQQLARCAVVDNKQERLACYDELARKHSPKAGQSQVHQYIQPPVKFLDSHLVSVPWKTEYTLTVRSFVDLIAHAVMENKKHVSVQGWSKDKQDYVLHITMQAPMQLHFMPRESVKDEMSMSLLRDVKMDGYTVGADLFIMDIAAMVPDKKTD